MIPSLLWPLNNSTEAVASCLASLKKCVSVESDGTCDHKYWVLSHWLLTRIRTPFKPSELLLPLPQRSSGNRYVVGKRLAHRWS